MAMRSYKKEDAAMRRFEEDAADSYSEESVLDSFSHEDAEECYDPEDAIELYDLDRMLPQWFDPEDTAELYDPEDTDVRHLPDEDVDLSKLDEATKSLRLFELSLCKKPSTTPQRTLENLRKKFDPCDEYPALAERMEQAEAIHMSSPSHLVPDSLKTDEILPEDDQLSNSSSEPELLVADLVDCGWDLVECFSRDYSDISSATSEADCPDLLTDESSPDRDSTVEHKTSYNETLYNDVKRILAKLRKDEEEEQKNREEMGSPPNKRPKWNLEGEHSKSVTSVYTGWSPDYSPTTPPSSVIDEAEDLTLREREFSHLAPKYQRCRYCQRTLSPESQQTLRCREEVADYIRNVVNIYGMDEVFASKVKQLIMHIGVKPHAFESFVAFYVKNKEPVNQPFVELDETLKTKLSYLIDYGVLIHIIG